MSKVQTEPLHFIVCVVKELFVEGILAVKDKSLKNNVIDSHQNSMLWERRGH